MSISVITFQIIQAATLIVAVFVAWVSIKKQRDTAKKNKTISLLMQDLEDDFLTDGLNILRSVDDNFHIEDFAKSNKKQSNEATAIRNLLNYYEIIGVDIEDDKKSTKNHDYPHLRTSRTFYYSL
ncbi:MAG: DUF4760 domain-containing protein [Gammaproteobacteria bacterium]|nr:DUF4760 domain-containing protein [Gammaproteobacteria bacterium]